MAMDYWFAKSQAKDIWPILMSRTSYPHNINNMTTIHIKLKDVYVDHLLAIIANHQEIQIDDIAIEGSSKTDNGQKLQKKQKLMRIA